MLTETLAVAAVVRGAGATIVLLAIGDRSDSTPCVVTARTPKYQVPAGSAVMVLVVVVAPATLTLWVRVDWDVPYWTRNPARLVRGLLSVFWVGATHDSAACPLAAGVGPVHVSV